MKKSMKSMKAFTELPVITKAHQKQLKGGTDVMKLCDQSFGTGGG